MKKLTLALLLFATAAQAETYKWTDQQGTVHFTDSLQSVPPKLRKSAVTAGSDTSVTFVSDVKETAPERKSAAAANPTKSADVGAVGSQVEGLKNRMMSDDAIMALITALQNDPEMQAILNDPAILRAVQSFDINTLMNNPAFLRLLDNPRVREIEKRLQ